MEISLEIIICSILDLESVKLKVIGDFISLVFSLAFFGIIALGAIYLGYYIYKNRDNALVLRERFGEMAMDIKIGNKLQISYFTFFMMFRLTFVLLVVFTYN